jgi:hypothetical protein
MRDLLRWANIPGYLVLHGDLAGEVLVLVSVVPSRLRAGVDRHVAAPV